MGSGNGSLIEAKTRRKEGGKKLWRTVEHRYAPKINTTDENLKCGKNASEANSKYQTTFHCVTVQTTPEVVPANHIRAELRVT